MGPNRFRGGLRRPLAGLLAAGLMLTAAPVRAAEAEMPAAPAPRPLPAESAPLTAPRVSRDEAIAAARAAFAIPAALGEPTVRLDRPAAAGARAVWYLHWRTPEGQRPAVSYSVAVDAGTGEILQFHFHREGDEELPPLSLTRREARQQAEEWLQKLAARYAAEVRARERPLEQFYFYPGSPAQYAFEWERVAAGYPVQGQGVTITIDARTGELVAYDLTWDPALAVTPPARLLSQAEAEAAFRAGVKLGLAYARVWQPGVDKPEWKLVYRPLGEYPLVDAATGRLLGGRGQAFAGPGWDDLTPLPAPDRPYTPPAEPLSQEEALALARQVAGRAEAPSRVEYHETGSPQPARTYHFTWQPPDSRPPKAGDRSASVVVDALRGLVQRYHSWGPGPENRSEARPAVDYAEAREKAVAWLTRFRPDLAPRLRLVPAAAEPYRWCRYPEEENAPDRPLCERYGFRFQLYHDGLPVLGVTAGVEVDIWTGEVAYFYAEDGALAGLPALPAAPAITAAEAMDSLIRYGELRPAWVTFHPDPVGVDLPLQPGGERPAPRTVLAYFLAGGQGWMVDAGTGHLLDPSGRDLNLLAAEPRDIEGHWAQKEMEVLLLRGIYELDADARVHPGRVVTRGEAARWLVLARGLQPRPYSGQFVLMDVARGEPAAQAAAPYAEAALVAGILEPADLGGNLAPGQPVTRQEFALWAARAMGYGAVARMPVQIPLAYSDAGRIAPRYRNAVALLAGLGVLSGTGEFRPEAPITRAEAARILYAVATHRQR